MSTAPYFPLIGAAGTDEAQAAAYDGRWLVVDADNRWLSARACPALAGISVSLRFGYLVLKAPGMLRMDIPLDVIEDDDSVKFAATAGDHTLDVIDEGELAAAWLSNLTGQPCALMKVHPDAPSVPWEALLAADGENAVGDQAGDETPKG